MLLLDIASRLSPCDQKESVLMLNQDNAPAHRAQETIMTIDALGFERLDHSPFSPDLAPHVQP